MHITIDKNYTSINYLPRLVCGHTIIQLLISANYGYPEARSFCGLTKGYWSTQLLAL